MRKKPKMMLQMRNKLSLDLKMMNPLNLTRTKNRLRMVRKLPEGSRTYSFSLMTSYLRTLTKIRSGATIGSVKSLAQALTHRSGFASINQLGHREL